MRKVPEKKKKNSKAVFTFVIILILLTFFLASFIISYNLMSGDRTADGAEDQTTVTDDYEQPKDMLNGNKSDSQQLSDLKLENATLKSEVSALEAENAQLRSEIQRLNATIENQQYVKNNASSGTQHQNSAAPQSPQEPKDETPSENGSLNNTATSDTGL